MQREEILFNFGFDGIVLFATNQYVHLLLGAVYISLFSACLVFLTNNTNASTYYLIEDVSGPVHKVDLYYPLCVVLLESFLFHIIYAANDYANAMKEKVALNSFRHIDSLCYKTMLIFILMVLVKIKYIFTIIEGVFLCGSFCLFQWAQDTKLVYYDIGNKLFFMSYFPFAALWVIIIKAFYNGINVTVDSVAGFTMYLIWITFSIMTLNGLIQLWYVVSLPKSFKVTKEHVQHYEGTYIILSTMEKLIFFTITLNGINNS